jgi:hypothetical protein
MISNQWDFSESLVAKATVGVPVGHRGETIANFQGFWIMGNPRLRVRWVGIGIKQQYASPRYRPKVYKVTVHAPLHITLMFRSA